MSWNYKVLYEAQLKLNASLIEENLRAHHKASLLEEAVLTVRGTSIESNLRHRGRRTSIRPSEKDA